MTRTPSKPGIGRILVLFAFMAALLLVVSVACGDDDAEDDLEPFLTRQAANGDGDDGELSDLTREYDRFEGYVKYEARDFPESESLDSMTIYQEGDRSRVDIESSQGPVTLIDVPDASYVCSPNQCVQYPAGDTGGVGSLFTSLVDPDTIEGQFGTADYDKNEERIAGLDATCFKADGNEVCFGEGGLLLRVRFAEGNGNGTLEAVEANTTLPDDAFEPPYEVIDLEGFGP